MTNEHDTERLSDYLDGELSPGEVAEIEAHLAGCEACASTLEDLRTLVSTAGNLPEVPPERELWPEIEARLEPRGRQAPDVLQLRPRRRVVMTVPQLIAAAIALVLFSASAVWLAVGGTGTPAAGPSLAGASSAVTNVVFKDFDRTIESLEQEYRSRRAELDPETIRVVERNLAIIDQAISEAREALAEDPSSGFLSAHLADAMRHKMDLLRQATLIEHTET